MECHVRRVKEDERNNVRVLELERHEIVEHKLDFLNESAFTRENGGIKFLFQLSLINLNRDNVFICPEIKLTRSGLEA